VRRIVLISNPGSGGADDADVPALLRDAGADVGELPIDAAAKGTDLDCDRVVVAGGDGSIAVAAEAARRTGAELAVVPAGTANDFAERMGLPSGIEDAAKLAGRGESSRAVDLARVGSRSFVNVASLGLSPVAADVAEELKDSLGALAYTVGAMRAGAQADPIHCRAECEGSELFEGDAWQVMVGCTGAFGGGSRIDADADDGRLDVVVIEGGPRAALAKRAIGLRVGTIEDQEGVRSARCRRIAVEISEPQQLNVDGELVGSDDLGGTRLEFQVEPKALRLVIP
jgi:diacylglycerol kinase (ATP)